MDMPKEGNSTVRPPLLDGSNYPYWKARMRAFLKSMDERVWRSVVNGWEKPTVVSGTETTSKPSDQWTKTDDENSNWNSKAINAIFSGVTLEEFRRISMCETAKYGIF